MAEIAPIHALPSDELSHVGTASLSTGTADLLYPVTNAITMDPAEPFLSSSSGTAIDIDIDHGTAKDAPFFSLHHHNIPAGTVCHLYRGASQGATTLDAPFTIGTLPEDGIGMPVGIDLTLLSGYNGATGYRWSRLHVPSLAQKVGIGSIMLWQAKRVDFTNVSYPVNDGETQPGTRFRTSFGVKRGRKLGIRLRSWPCTFRFKTDAAYAAFLSLFRSCQGQSNAFLWVRDPVSSDAVLAGFSDDSLAKSLPYSGIHDLTVTIEELAWGASLPT